MKKTQKHMLLAARRNYTSKNGSGTSARLYFTLRMLARILVCLFATP